MREACVVAPVESLLLLLLMLFDDDDDGGGGGGGSEYGLLMRCDCLGHDVRHCTWADTL